MRQSTNCSTATDARLHELCQKVWRGYRALCEAKAGKALGCTAASRASVCWGREAVELQQCSQTNLKAPHM